MIDSILYRPTESEHYDREAHVFGIDYYDRDSKGEDDFSRKLIWFYVYGDEDIRAEFRGSMEYLFEHLFEEDSENWDILTLYPTSTEGEVNTNLRKLFEEVIDGSSIDYDQVIFRNRNIEENHEINSVRKKVLNLEDSIDITGDVEGKNVIVADNITLSGTSMMHAVQELYRAGANKVACVCLGLGLEGKKNDQELEGNTAATEIINNYGKNPNNNT